MLVNDYSNCCILVSAVVSVSHWCLAVSGDMQTLLITVTKDGLLINSTAVLSVEKKSISK